MERIVTTLLDVLGLLLVAAGAYYLTAVHLGRGALLVSGVVVLAGSAFASREPSGQPVRERIAAWWQARRGRGAA